MWVRRDIESLTLVGSTGLTIGAFDGVHRGHQALIRWMADGARQAGMRAVVLTFDPLPRLILGRSTNGALSTLEERLDYMRPLGLDGVIVYPFDRQTAAISATDFVTWLVEKLALAGLWVGPDFALGHNHEGDIPFLEAGAYRLQILAEEFQPYTRAPLTITAGTSTTLPPITLHLAEERTSSAEGQGFPRQ